MDDPNPPLGRYKYNECAADCPRWNCLITYGTPRWYTVSNCGDVEFMEPQFIDDPLWAEGAELRTQFEEKLKDAGERRASCNGISTQPF